MDYVINHQPYDQPDIFAISDVPVILRLRLTWIFQKICGIGLIFAKFQSDEVLWYKTSDHYLRPRDPAYKVIGMDIEE